MLAVSSFTTLIRSATFRFTPFRYTTSLRSFHSPQHRTAKAIPSLHSTKQSHRLSVSWHLLIQRYMVFCVGIIYKKPPQHKANCSCHSKPSNAFVPFHSVIAFAKNHPHNRKRYALFFSAKCLPQPAHERQYSST